MNSQVLLSTQQSQLVQYDDDELTSLLRRVEDQLPEIKEQLIHDPEFKMGTKKCVSHRAVGFFSDEVKEYNYSNTHTQANPITKPLADLMHSVNAKLQTSFNGVLVNWYRDGRDSIGMHHDKELEVDPTGKVAMVCFGAKRELKFRPYVPKAAKATKTTKKTKTTKILTEPGYLYCMEGQFQQEFKHGIDADPTVTEERLSVTFRCHRKKPTRATRAKKQT